MKWFVRNWYWCGLAFAAIAAAVLIACWNDMGVLQKLLLANFIALNIHQVEEYGWPGGEPMIMNYAMMGSDIPDRFPLNRLSAMVTNDLVLVLMYLVPVFFPDVIWLGLPGMLFGIGQLFAHGVMNNRAMHTVYNPGLAAVLFLHVPIGVYYIYYISVNGLATGWDWLWGVLLTLLTAVVCVAWLTYVIMPSRRSTWTFSQAEMERFHVKEKMERKGIDVPTGPGKGMFWKTPLFKIWSRLHPKG